MSFSFFSTSDTIFEIISSFLSFSFWMPLRYSILLSFPPPVIPMSVEAASADIGITGGGKDSNMLYLNGIQKEKLKNDEIISKIVSLVEKKEKDIKNKI